MKKDNEIEKYRRVELDLQNQIKERDYILQQKKQQIEQLERRVEIIDAIKQLSSAKLSENEIRTIAREVDEAGKKYGHDPLLYVAVMATESSFRPNVNSHVGAHGLMQIMPSTGSWLTSQVSKAPKSVGMEEGSADELPTYRDIEGNIKLGTLYLTQLMMRYNNLRDAIFAYNLGPGTFEERRANGGPMPVEYLGKIKSTYEKLVAQRENRELPFHPTLDITEDSLLAKADVDIP
ncbi:MAG: transglycosylase SLT domain-containing protein [bacterium]